MKLIIFFDVWDDIKTAIQNQRDKNEHQNNEVVKSYFRLETNRSLLSS